jgi:hypothetical protein
MSDPAQPEALGALGSVPSFYRANPVAFAWYFPALSKPCDPVTGSIPAFFRAGFPALPIAGKIGSGKPPQS